MTLENAATIFYKTRAKNFTKRGVKTLRNAGQRGVDVGHTDFIPRWVSKIICEKLKYSRVVELTGPRQCGKTSLVKKLIGSNPNMTYRTLDDLTLLESAKKDPMGFLWHKHDKETLIIDEIQRVPDLLIAIKMTVDENSRPGQFLITGSARIKNLPQVQESLAGRSSNVRLRPLSVGEAEFKAPDLLERIFSGEVFKEHYGEPSRETLIGNIFRGGFPEPISYGDAKARKSWHKDYLKSLLEHDLRDLSRIHDFKALNQLVFALAAWSAQLVNFSKIGEKFSISRQTLKSYFSVLELLYLVEMLPPWTKTDYQRVGHQEKVYMTDTGLMSSILNWRVEDVVLDSDRSGKAVETFVFNELSSYVDASDGEYSLFHYRDREKREIDFVLERSSDGALVGIEVKAGKTGFEDFKNLIWFKENIVRDRKFTGIVLHRGANPSPFGQDLWALPIDVFWRR